MGAGVHRLEELSSAGPEVLLAEATGAGEAILDGRLRPARTRSPSFALPFPRADFWPVVAAAAGAVSVAAWWRRRR